MKSFFITGLLATTIVLAAVACGGEGAEREGASPTPSAPAATEAPPLVGHGPPVPQFRELPEAEENTGGIRWMEMSIAGVTFRFPADDKEWEAYYGGQDVELQEVTFRLTHLPTGQARKYSLVSGRLKTCSARIVTDQAAQVSDDGQDVECASQELTALERQVFARVATSIAGSHQLGPPWRARDTATSVPRTPQPAATPPGGP